MRRKRLRKLTWDIAESPVMYSNLPTGTQLRLSLLDPAEPDRPTVLVLSVAEADLLGSKLVGSVRNARGEW